MTDSCECVHKHAHMVMCMQTIFLHALPISLAFQVHLERQGYLQNWVDMLVMSDTCAYGHKRAHMLIGMHTLKHACIILLSFVLWPIIWAF